ncbi:MAG: ABC transporter permease, partial [Acidobacteriota bacterium]|nr:ABC transporter permease [Acidobacteriota bacterium]
MLHRLRTLWRNFTHRHRLEQDLDAELRAYQQMLEDEKLNRGASESAARREALLEMRGIEQIKEEVRAVRLGVTVETFAAELRQSFRSLRRSPAASLSIVAILALGMSASTVIFSVVQSILLKPLPFRDSQRVVEVTESRVARGLDFNAFGEANFWDVRAANRSFAELAAYHDDDFTLTGRGVPEKISGAAVTAGFFRTLGVSPIQGRDFSYDEGRGGDPNFWNGRP